jgi:hypothetical protein
MIYQFSNRGAALRAAEQLRKGSNLDCVTYEEKEDSKHPQNKRLWAVEAVPRGFVHQREKDLQRVRERGESKNDLQRQED